MCNKKQKHKFSMYWAWDYRLDDQNDREDYILYYSCKCGFKDEIDITDKNNSNNDIYAIGHSLQCPECGEHEFERIKTFYKQHYSQPCSMKVEVNYEENKYNKGKKMIRVGLDYYSYYSSRDHVYTRKFHERITYNLESGLTYYIFKNKDNNNGNHIIRHYGNRTLYFERNYPFHISMYGSNKNINFKDFSHEILKEFEKSNIDIQSNNLLKNYFDVFSTPVDDNIDLNKLLSFFAFINRYQDNLDSINKMIGINPLFVSDLTDLYMTSTKFEHSHFDKLLKNNNNESRPNKISENIFETLKLFGFKENIINIIKENANDIFNKVLRLKDMLVYDKGYEKFNFYKHLKVDNARKIFKAKNNYMLRHPNEFRFRHIMKKINKLLEYYLDFNNETIACNKVKRILEKDVKDICSDKKTNDGLFNYVIDLLKSIEQSKDMDEIKSPELNDLTDKEIIIYHDKLPEQIAIIQNKEYNKQYKKRLPVLNELEYSNDNMCIKIPQNLGEIINEGNNMNHCVGNYLKSCAEGDDTIVFLRDIDNNRIATVNLSSSTNRYDVYISQAKKKNNININNKEKDFLNKYIDYVNDILNEMECELGKEIKYFGKDNVDEKDSEEKITENYHENIPEDPTFDVPF